MNEKKVDPLTDIRVFSRRHVMEQLDLFDGLQVLIPLSKRGRDEIENVLVERLSDALLAIWPRRVEGAAS